MRKYRGNVKAQNNRSYSRGRAWIQELKSAPCTDCKQQFHWSVMQFDHVRGAKVDCISNMLRIKKERLMEELSKCELVCANCHAFRTWQRKQGGREHGG